MTNAIARVEIKDFLVFKGEFAEDFCPGVNVLIGGNGTGKTTLMKLMYAACARKESDSSADSVKKFVLPYFGAGDNLGYCSIKCLFSNSAPIEWVYKDSPEQVPHVANQEKFSQPAMQMYDKVTVEIRNTLTPDGVYIPTEEMLSHSETLLALNNERKIPFDQTLIDVLSKAELGETRKITSNAEKVLDRIKNVIGGEVFYENDKFYIVRPDIGKVPFSLEASGFRKLGLLWKLLRNGLLEAGSILFWDEPEESMNPELIPALADILLELQRGGVQIFAATHSFDVARWIELSKQPENTLRYLNLRKEGGRIVADVADNYETLPRSVIDEADDVLLRRSVQAAAASAGVKLQ
ncbi:MAG: ATP-binding protein [Clostridiales bacterium]|jgi:predicted ATP-dependent endonuclease of OLD family|nr:ATP-binding protein [Clostridiales bacterium]